MEGWKSSAVGTEYRPTRQRILLETGEIDPLSNAIVAILKDFDTTLKAFANDAKRPILSVSPETRAKKFTETFQHHTTRGRKGGSKTARVHIFMTALEIFKYEQRLTGELRDNCHDGCVRIIDSTINRNRQYP